MIYAIAQILACRRTLLLFKKKSKILNYKEKNKKYLTFFIKKNK